MVWRDLIAVLVGGALGTGIRLAIDTAIPHPDDAFPVSTLIVNTLGALVLGLLVARVWQKAPSWLRAGLGAGLLGSFTTFSAVAVSLVTLTSVGEWMLGLGYVAITLVLGLGAAALGLHFGRRTATPIDLVDE